MLLRKNTPGNAQGDLVWKGGDVLEVDDDLAAELLAIPGQDFEAVSAEQPSESPKAAARRKSVTEALS